MNIKEETKTREWKERVQRNARLQRESEINKIINKLMVNIYKRRPHASKSIDK
jgi:hypothetical protein